MIPLFPEYNYLKYINKYLLLLIIVASLFANCYSAKEVDMKYQKIQSIISDSLQVSENFEHIFILSEYGCPVCNSQLYEYMLEAKHEKSLYIISNLGSRLDLTKFESNFNNAVVIFDYKDLMYRSKIIGNGSAYIHVVESSIDTIINLNIENIESSIRYIN